MSTAFMRVALAMRTCLQAATPIAAIVEIARTRTLPEQSATALVVRPGRAVRDRGVGRGAPVIWASAMVLECYARGTSAAPAADAVDELLDAAVHRLMADPSLGGLVGSLDPESIEWDYDVDGAQTACATVTFLVRHATAAARLTKP